MSSSPPDRKSIPRLEGKRLGRYQILGHVAAGGMATVHVARAESTFTATSRSKPKVPSAQ